jgi:hypothetical protein
VLQWVWAERDAGRYAELNARAYAFVSLAVNVDDPERGETTPGK